MRKIKLLVVEDSEDEFAVCQSTAIRYQEETGRQVELVGCRTVAEAEHELDKTFDGAIIDIRLGNELTAGNEVVEAIASMRTCVPILILTATPYAAIKQGAVVEVYNRAEEGSRYTDLFDRLWSICRTGITQILGGRGTFETKLAEVFSDNIVPQIAKWEQHGANDADKTHKALLRHTLNHLAQLIDEEVEHCYPEEFYLSPPPGSRVRTGSMLKERDGERRYVVLSPDCDLVVRGDEGRNTDAILIVEAFDASTVLSWFDKPSMYELSRTKRGKLDRWLDNNGNNYSHCLPESGDFPLRFLNFRKVNTIGETDLSERFGETPEAQISPMFVKDILSRFSTYYARQGQPDIEYGG